MPVRATYYWDCEAKPSVSDDTYRYTFHQTQCLGRYVSIDLSPNLLFRKIGIDRPFTKPIVCDDRYRQTFHHSIVSDDRYRYVVRRPFAILLFQRWRAEALEDSPSRYNRFQFAFHHPRRTHLQPSGESPNTGLSVLVVPYKLKVDGLNNKVVVTIR